jgi:hypothetical protein
MLRILNWIAARIAAIPGDVRRLFSVLFAFRTSSNALASPGWRETSSALRRLAMVATVVSAATVVVLWLLVTVMSAAGRPFPDGLWYFFPGKVVYRLYVVFTPILFALLMTAASRLSPGPAPLTLAQALQIALDVTAAVAAAMLALLMTPYFVILLIAMRTGLGATTDMLLSIVGIYQAVVVAALWLIYWLSAAGMVARTRGAPFLRSAALVLVCGGLTFWAAFALDPLVFRVTEPYWK